MGLQWDRPYLVAGDGTRSINNGSLRRYKIEGTTGTSVDVIKLGTAWGFFIQGSTALVADGSGIERYDYPGGTQKNKEIDAYGAYEATVSVAKRV